MAGLEETLARRIRIPVDEFVAVGRRAERLAKEAPDLQYLAGVWATVSWIMGWAASPLHGEPVEPDEMSIWAEGVLANHISRGFPYPGRRIDGDYAAGVAMTAWWVQKDNDYSPLDPPASRAG